MLYGIVVLAAWRHQDVRARGAVRQGMKMTARGGSVRTISVVMYGIRVASHICNCNGVTAGDDCPYSIVHICRVLQNGQSRCNGQWERTILTSRCFTASNRPKALPRCNRRYVCDTASATSTHLSTRAGLQTHAHMALIESPTQPPRRIAP